MSLTHMHGGGIRVKCVGWRRRVSGNAIAIEEENSRRYEMASGVLSFRRF